MANQRTPIEFNSLSGGLITEATALTFPDGASIDERNFELGKDGRRSRRLGFEQEFGGINIAVPILYNGKADAKFNTFLWKNVGGVNGLEIVVVQVLGLIHYFNNDDESITLGKYDKVTTIYANESEYPDNSIGLPVFDFASVNGTLVIATGRADIITVIPVFDGYGGLTLDDSEVSRLTIRDLFGIPVRYDRGRESSPYVEDFIYITDQDHITKRPIEAGLPDVDNQPEPVNIAVGSTRTWVTRTSVELSAGIYETTHSGALASSESISPSSLAGHTIYSIEEKSSVRVSGGDPVVITELRFTTVPEFSQVTLKDLDTAESVLLVQSGFDGREFVFEGGFPGVISVPSPLNLSLTIILATVKNSLFKYNLRNQTFGVKRLPKTGDAITDPIQSFFDIAAKFPSSSDSIISALYNNIEESNKTAERFHAEDLVVNPAGSAPAPKGYFIIDALERSTSRVTKWQELANDEEYADEVTQPPVDRTPFGATAVAEFGGRLWFGGFSEEGNFTEQGGTRLDSYLLFSQLSTSSSALTKCYQKGDPTSISEPELLDTDGGFLALDGAYGIHKIVPLGNSLLAFASNGVWAVSGADDNYFTPTAPRVRLVTSKGSISPRSIVVIDSVAMYWAEDGIYIIVPSELGSYNVESLTEKTIQTFYNEVPIDVKKDVSGNYDAFTGTVSWYIYTTSRRVNKTQVLTLLTTTGAFTVQELSEGLTSRTLVGPVEVSPFLLSAGIVSVAVGGNKVVTGTGANVSVDSLARASRPLGKKAMYIQDAGDGTSTYSFGEFSNVSFKDWGETDAPSYMITGYVSGGDFQRYKRTPYITFHFEKTEDSTVCPIDLNKQSSCLVQAQWDWANNVNSGRWSRTFQAYRFRKHYVPAEMGEFDNGFSTVVTKNKIRGKGRVLSLLISSEPEKDCRILGWSAIMEVNANV